MPFGNHNGRSDDNRFRGRVRPGKATSLMGMIIGIGFAILGLAMMSEMSSGMPPGMGVPAPFMMLWLMIAGGAAVFYGYNYFSEQGASVMEVDLDLPSRPSPASPNTSSTPPAASGDFADRLRKLEQLRDDRLITEQEYQQKRAEILNERW